jgi:hypothetical protein
MVLGIKYLDFVVQASEFLTIRLFVFLYRMSVEFDQRITGFAFSNPPLTFLIFQYDFPS